MDLATGTTGLTVAPAGQATDWAPDPLILARRPRTWKEARAFYVAELERAMALGEQAYYDTLGIWGEHDLWFLLVHVLRRPDVGNHPWLFDRCREVEAEPNGVLDLWARYHYKSTIITFGLTLQDIIKDPEVTFGIFAHTRPIAKGFLRQIKLEMEQNPLLHQVWPDVFWTDPAREAPKWSEDEGITVKRRSNPKEATIEAWGLVDGMPTSRHYRVRLYDDAVSRESVQSDLMIKKTEDAWELSINLGMPGGVERYAGTRWHLYDLYNTMMERGVVKVRRYPATHDGKRDGRPVFISAAEWQAHKVKQRRTLNSQMLQSPLADDASTFDPKTLRGYQLRPQWLNVYILVDPSKGPQSASKDSDNSAIAVVGVASTGARYFLDGYCHRMKLSQRWQALVALVRRWEAEPGVINVAVGYEQYGHQTDMEYIDHMMDITKITFSVQPVAWPREGPGSKRERIERLEPYFNQSQFFLPILTHPSLAPTPGPQTEDGTPILGADGKPIRWRYSTWTVDRDTDQIRYRGLRADTQTIVAARAEGRERLVIRPIVRRNEHGELYDVTARFIQEFSTHPVGKHEDLLDATSRIEDMQAIPAIIGASREAERPRFRD